MNPKFIAKVRDARARAIVCVREAAGNMGLEGHSVAPRDKKRYILEGTRQILAEESPKEKWLHNKPHAMASIMRGMEQTAKGEFVEPPDWKADVRFFEQLGER